MSWTISIPPTTRGDFDDAIDAAIPGGQDDLPTERDQQVAVAKDLAKMIAHSNAVGGGAFQASLYGHANPDHASRPGWANDTITVSVSQVTEPKSQEPAPVPGTTAAKEEVSG